MAISKTIRAIVSVSLLGFCSLTLLAGDIGVEGNVTATNFIGSGAGLTGVVMDGIEIGDMQYWDGASWVLVPAPSVNAKMLSLCSGLPKWTTTGCFNIGDAGPAGGVVFYITDGGSHGLEAAPEDQSSGAEWGCKGVTITGADETIVGTGLQNTADIIAGCADAGIAARLADEYTLHGFDHWFLPSIDELNLLYQQKTVVGGFTEDYYWSSTEFDANAAWDHSFTNDSQTHFDKNLTFGVRAIRAF